MGYRNAMRDAISIHALLAESDGHLAVALHNVNVFLSTLSLRRATRARRQLYVHHIISIHALLAESDGYQRYAELPKPISIHALLAESDNQPDGNDSDRAISIHALLAESDIGAQIARAISW